MAFPIRSENDPISAALALIGDHLRLTSAETNIIGEIRAMADSPSLRSLAKDIGEGKDPLGEAFLSLRVAQTRRTSGQAFTPRAIINAMISMADRAVHHGRRFSCIVDAGAGSGRFLLAAATAFPDAHLVAVEADPLCALVLRANLAVHGLLERSKILVEDFRNVCLDLSKGRVLFIGNPPYVRHHDLSAESKTWYTTTMQSLGMPRASKLAGLHVHFFARAAQLARRGDLGIYVTSAEWLSTNYGSALRAALCGPLGGRAIYVLDAQSQPFPGVMTTAAISVFEPHSDSESLRFASLPGADHLSFDPAFREISAEDARLAPVWPPARFAPPHVARKAGTRIGDLFRVSRGQVTGLNSVWVADTLAQRLVPSRFLLPCVTSAKELFDAYEDSGRLTEDSFPRKVVNLPQDLDSALVSGEHSLVKRFLDWAVRMGAHNAYVARHRSPWWAIKPHQPAPLICAYMARRAPAFIRNDVGARLLNIAHGLYPRVPLTPTELDQVLEALNRSVQSESGRVYAGGLRKFEPGAIENLIIGWCPEQPSPQVAAE